MLSKDDAVIIGLIEPLIVLLIMDLIAQYVVHGRKFWLLLLAAIYPVTNVAIPLYLFYKYLPDGPIYSILIVLLFRFLELGPGKGAAEFKKHWYAKQNKSTKIVDAPLKTNALIAIDREKKEWLRTRLSEAAFITFIISCCTLIFGAAGRELRNELNFFAYLVGLCIGIFLGSRGFPNPTGISFVMQRKNLIMDKAEVESYLKPIWKKMPRFYFLIANVPYGILPIFLWSNPGMQPGNQPLITFLTGFISSFVICIFVSSLYMFLQLRNAEK